MGFFTIYFLDFADELGLLSVISVSSFLTLGPLHGRDRVALVRQAVVTLHAVLVARRLLLEVLRLLTKNTIKHFLIPNRVRLL